MRSISATVVREKGRELGIHVLRFSLAVELRGHADTLASRARAGMLPAGFCRDEHHVLRRSVPSVHLRGARTVICGALGYYRRELEDGTRPGQPHGRIGRYTWCDYYGELRQRLRELAAWIRQERPGTRSVAYSNYTSLAEKPLAVRSGIGWQGKNSLILNHSLGSWLILGELVTQAEIEPDSAEADGCGRCDACVRACPTGALVSPGVLDARRCIQHRCGTDGHIPAAMRQVWENRLYGCDTCQEACPYNQSVAEIGLHASRGCVGPSVPLLPLLSLTDDDIRERFGANQMAKPWVRPEYLLRNAAVALGNMGDEASVPGLSRALAHPSVLVRGAAAWALGRLGGKGAAIALSARWMVETDPAVVDELRAALDRGGESGNR
jgi:epoxyqueuosine reductase